MIKVICKITFSILFGNKCSIFLLCFYLQYKMINTLYNILYIIIINTNIKK